MRKSHRPSFYVDVSPLWELQYTGISNVVFELSRRLIDQDELPIRFTAMAKPVPTAVIAACLNARGGSDLHTYFARSSPQPLSVAADGSVDGRRAVGLFTNTKPARRVFSSDSQIFYDFSPLLTPECHTADTVRHHMTHLEEQIASNNISFCISESTASDLHQIFGVARDRIKVCLLGNNVNTTLADRLRGLLAAQPVESFFLVLGTIEPRKNVPFVLDWIRRDPELLRRHRFVFAGREGWGPTFAELVSQANLDQALAEGRIVHLGYVDEWTKAALLVAAEALIFPSVFEGFGLPILEAMSLGTPVLCSVSTSLPEVLGDTGYYFDPYSLDALTRAYSGFMLDRQHGLLDHVKRRARYRASTFSYDKTYRTVVDGLAQLESEL